MFDIRRKNTTWFAVGLEVFGQISTSLMTICLIWDTDPLRFRGVNTSNSLHWTLSWGIKGCWGRHCLTHEFNRLEGDI